MEITNRLSLKQIRYFTTIAESGSFRQAAFRLDVTQPALSSQIAILEKLLDLQLFERSKNGTTTTVEGRELLPSAKRILEEVHGFASKSRMLSGGGMGTYRLGVTPTLGPYLLPHILGPIHAKHQGLKLYVREEAPSDLEAGLLDRRHDLILSTQPIMSKELTVFQLFREPLKFAVSMDHRLARKPHLDCSDLLGEQVLTISEHHLFHRQIVELCEKVGAEVRRDFEGTSLDTLRQMVVMGMGTAFLPALYVKSEIREENELRIADVEGVNVVRNHVLAWRKTSPEKSFYLDLAREIRDIVEQNLSDVVIPIKTDK
ncbi:MAG: hydrogen peroxide-inducible genes activator [Gammaproteobacteria bacterium]|nr:hydrogen peroxide-inducible genes activator [Gammaproteobacteria bacterium]